METSGSWAGLEPELIALVAAQSSAQSSNRSSEKAQLRDLLLVCRSWNLALRQQVVSLSPCFLGPADAAGGAARWPFVAAVNVPLVRSMHDGALQARLPLCRHDSAHPGSLEDYPSLRHVDFSGQVLLQCMQHTRLPSESLRSLSLSLSTVSLKWLISEIRGMTSLQRLALAGLVCPDLARHKEELLSAVCSLPQLTALDLRHEWLLPGAFVFTAGGYCSLLLSLSSTLTHLSLDKERLVDADVAAIGQLSRLRSLELDWHPHRDQYSASHVRGSLSNASWIHLLNLTQLTSLRAYFASYAHPAPAAPHLFAPGGGLPPALETLEFSEQMTLAPLTRLRRVGLPGCPLHGLVLSIIKLGPSVTELDLSCCRQTVTPQLVVQVCSKLPNLTALDVTLSQWSHPFGQFTLPGDVLLAGLAAVCSQLRTLLMHGIDSHGVGLGYSLPSTSSSSVQPAPSTSTPSAARSATANGAGPSQPAGGSSSNGGASSSSLHRPPPSRVSGLSGLWDLEVSGRRLLKGTLHELRRLRQLRSLTLTGVKSGAFQSASKVGSYLALSSLSSLTSLRILEPRGRVTDERHYPFSEYLALMAQLMGEAEAGAEEGEPLEDDWVPVEHPAGQVGLPAAVLPGPGGAGAAHPIVGGLQQQQLQLEQENGGDFEGDEGAFGAAGGGEGEGGLGGGGANGAFAEAQHLEAAGDPSGAHRSPPDLPPAVEPHLHFISSLRSLRVLALTCLVTSGSCLRHLSGRLPQLRTLSLLGEVVLTAEGLEVIGGLRLPALRSLQLARCSFHCCLLSEEDSPSASSHDNNTPRSGMASFLGMSLSSPRKQSLTQAAASSDRPAAGPSGIGDAPGGISEGPHGPGNERGMVAGLSSLDCGAEAPQAPPLLLGREAERGGRRPCGLERLLSALTRALPQLEHLELGDCPGLTEQLLGGLVASLSGLRYLVLHGQQALSEKRCAAVLSPMDQLQYLASWPTSAAMQHARGGIWVPKGRSGAGRPHSGLPPPSSSLAPSASCGAGPSGPGWWGLDATQQQPHREQADRMQQQPSESLPGSEWFTESPRGAVDQDLVALGGFRLARVGAQLQRVRQE